MFLIDYKTALISYFVIGALFVYLIVRDPNVNWGTSTSAFAYLSTLHSILKLQNTPDHVKTFRPQILAVTGDPKRNPALVTLGTIFKYYTHQKKILLGQIFNHVKAALKRYT